MDSQESSPIETHDFPSAKARRIFLRNNLVLFALLFGLWLLMSGHYDFSHIFIGLLCSILVVVLNERLTISFSAALTE